MGKQPKLPYIPERWQAKTQVRATESAIDIELRPTLGSVRIHKMLLDLRNRGPNAAELNWNSIGPQSPEVVKDFCAALTAACWIAGELDAMYPVKEEDADGSAGE